MTAARHEPCRPETSVARSHSRPYGALASLGPVRYAKAAEFFRERYSMNTDSPLGVLGLLLSSLVVRPLSLIWPKDPECVAFLPREGGRYIDNVAHLYERLRAEGRLPKRAYLLVDGGRTAKGWRAKERNARPYLPFEPKSLLLYLRTSLIVADSWQWVLRGRFACFYGAKRVQIWHGIPLKKIELSNRDARSMRGLLGLAQSFVHFLNGRFPRYDLVVSTSEFFEERAFRRSFEAGRFVNSGYPRNDYFLLDEARRPEVDSDALTLDTLRTLKAEGHRVVVYAPTFRDTGGGPFEDSAISLLRLKEFAERHKLVVVTKLHPYESNPPPSYLWPYVVCYDSAKDVAPLLALADLLVTDYSSIYFDYLFVNRPIVFFPYDFEKYFRHDRGFLFEYEEMTPGPLCRTQDDLEARILEELDSPSADYEARRRRLKSLSFSTPDGSASLRLWDAVETFL